MPALPLLANGAFLGVMIWRAPATSFRALSVRGDWILDGHDGPIAAAAAARLPITRAAGAPTNWMFDYTEPPEPSEQTPSILDLARPIQSVSGLAGRARLSPI